MSRGRRARIQLHLHIQREKIVVRVCSMRRLKSKFNTERSRIDPVICTSPNQEPVSFVIGPAVIKHTHTPSPAGFWIWVSPSSSPPHTAHAHDYLFPVYM